jgi:hypothetical protein
MLGIVEIITLLLGLNGFGLTPNPKAPTADQSLQYAMPDADIVAHFDAASVIPGNYKALTQLADQPAIKASPELSKAVRQVVSEVEGARGLAKTTTGIDLATDISDATAFLQIVPGGKDPNFVVAVRGKLTTAIIDKVAAAVGQPATKVGAAAMVMMDAPKSGKDVPALGVTKDGVLLVGTSKLVKDRIADTWKMPARAAGSNLAAVAEVIDSKPVFAFVVTMSAAARKEASEKLGPKNFLTDVITRHKVAAFSIYHDGIGWLWGDSSKAGMDQMAMVFEGMLDFMRAAQIAPRGMAKMALGAIDSYKGTSKNVDEVIKRKADILKIVETYSGDGNFKVTFDKDPKTLRIKVRATGKTLSEVLPAAMVIPGAAFALIVQRSPGSPPMSSPAVALPPPAPAKPVTPPPPPKKK